MKGKWLISMLFVSALTPMWSLAEDHTVRYSVTDLGTLGGASSTPCAINSREQVVGFSSIASGESHAFLWSDDVMTDLGTLPGDFFSLARDINKRSGWLRRIL